MESVSVSLKFCVVAIYRLESIGELFIIQFKVLPGIEFDNLLYVRHLIFMVL